MARYGRPSAYARRDNRWRPCLPGRLRRAQRPPAAASAERAPEQSSAEHLESRALAILLVGVSIALVWILLPFYGTIMWGAIIAMLFAPLYRRLLARLNHRRTLAALLTMVVVLLIVIVPFALLTASLAAEATRVYQRVESGDIDVAVYLRKLFSTLPDWLTGILERFGMADFEALQRRLASALSQGSRLIATRALDIGQNTLEFVVSLFVTLYLAFFLIRDGAAIARAIRRAIPMTFGHKGELLDTFTTVVRATVRGNLVVAAVQGALGGLAFWVLGVNGAILWAVVMAFLSLLPAVGAALVWLPAALYLLATGAVWQGVALAVYGVLVIGLVDNVLRPILVGKDTQMPDYLVLITTLGGISVIGVNGFVVGPTIAAMFIAVWHIYGVERPRSPP